MVTVAAELQRRGELQRIGGAPYLHTLSANVPIAANAGYYAEIVREKAILRRLVDAGTKIVQIGYAGEGQVDDIVDTAQAEVYKITDRRTAEDYAPLSDIMDGVLDEIEAIGNREAGLYGVPDRLRRPRRPDQRSARRPDDHRRGPPGDGQGAGARHPAAHPRRAGPRWARSAVGDRSSTPRAGRPGRRRDRRADSTARATRSSSPTAPDRRRRAAPVADRMRALVAGVRRPCTLAIRGQRVRTVAAAERLRGTATATRRCRMARAVKVDAASSS